MEDEDQSKMDEGDMSNQLGDNEKLERSVSLKSATSRLKEEALKRYTMKDSPQGVGIGSGDQKAGTDLSSHGNEYISGVPKETGDGDPIEQPAKHSPESTDLMTGVDRDMVNNGNSPSKDKVGDTTEAKLHADNVHVEGSAGIKVDEKSELHRESDSNISGYEPEDASPQKAQSDELSLSEHGETHLHIEPHTEGDPQSLDGIRETNLQEKQLKIGDVKDVEEDGEATVDNSESDLLEDTRVTDQSVEEQAHDAPADPSADADPSEDQQEPQPDKPDVGSDEAQPDIPADDEPEPAAEDLGDGGPDIKDTSEEISATEPSPEEADKEIQGESQPGDATEEVQGEDGDNNDDDDDDVEEQAATLVDQSTEANAQVPQTTDSSQLEEDSQMDKDTPKQDEEILQENGDTTMPPPTESDQQPDIAAPDDDQEMPQESQPQENQPSQQETLTQQESQDATADDAPAVPEDDDQEMPQESQPQENQPSQQETLTQQVSQDATADDVPAVPEDDASKAAAEVTEASTENVRMEVDPQSGETTPVEISAEDNVTKTEESVEKTEGEAGDAGQAADDSPQEKTEATGADEADVPKDDTADKDGEANLVYAELKAKKEVKQIPDDFFYDVEKRASTALVQEDSGLPLDMLTFDHSFGYDCTKRANLHMLDEDTLMFAAGNLVQLLKLASKEQIYLRSTSGGGIGAIAVHPEHNYFAVAEKGNSPDINIYEYPSLKLYRILRAGTEKIYSFVSFSPDGEFLASQGGDPDYMLTVWNWKQEKIMLRSKAFSQDIFRVSFSTELEGQLTTAGTGHIRFWKMANTFTGLKLQGQLGKFGKMEMSDIEGYVELPDGKVLSGCEWGNLLVWDGGLIKVEISRRHKKSCHVGPIQQILLDEGELMTIGVDGFIRVWDFETIDTAESADESCHFEMEPMNELKVGSDVKLKIIVKSIDAENEPTIWYAQDANGGIWKLDLSFSHTSHAPDELASFHAGAITAADISPLSHLIATTGVDKSVHLYDYSSKKLLCEQQYTAAGTCLIWAPTVVDRDGGTIIVGFADGVVRVFSIIRMEADAIDITTGRRAKDECDLILTQAFKPHTKPVSCLAVDPKGKILATGSADGTVFFMSIGETYEAIGYLMVAAEIKQLEWSREGFSKLTLLAICDDGNVIEIDAPELGKFDTSHTFKITGLDMKSFQFQSVKSALRHEEDMVRKAKQEEERKKKEEEERKKRIDRGLETESEHGSDKETTKQVDNWKPFIPSTPSPICYGFYGRTEGTFWLSMGEFDSGYLYECTFHGDGADAGKPIRSIPLLESNDVPITQIKFSADGSQVLMGLEDGTIRIQQLDQDIKLEERDFSTVGPFWSLNMHDNHYGKITSLLESHDSKFVLSVGEDGNFFTYHLMAQETVQQEVKKFRAKIPDRRSEDIEKVADDIEDPNAYSIEDAKQKSEYDKMMRLAEEKKRDSRRQIAKLRRQFKTILEQNMNLPVHLQLKRKEFELDPEIQRELQVQTENKTEQVKKEMAWESEKHNIALDKLKKRFKDSVECERIVVKAFVTIHEVSSYRAPKLTENFYEIKAEFQKRRATFFSSRDATRDPTHLSMSIHDQQAETARSMIDGRSPTDQAKLQTSLKGSMGERIAKALQKVEEKKRKRAARKAQWDGLFRNKPDENYEDPDDVTAIKEAKENMGDYKLKTAKDYVVPDHLRMNVDKAKGRLLTLKDLIHQYKYDFNDELLTLRDKKIRVIEEIRDLVLKLEQVQTKLDPSKLKPVPAVPEMQPEEMPERKYEYTRETLLQFKIELASKQLAEKQAASGGGFGGGFGGFGGGNEAKPSAPAAAPKQASTITSTSKTPDTMAQESSSEAVVSKKLSPLARRMLLESEIRLMYEQDSILGQINDQLQKFDAELRLLRHDKFKMDVVMKNADLREVTLFEELLLLKEFEKREDVLAAKVDAKDHEKLDMQTKIVDCQSKLDGKKKDIEKLQDKEKSLNSTFVTSLGENNKFAEYLTKVFKKKIKRVKKKTAEGEGSDDESDEDSDDESDWDESDEESESETGGYDLDVCPPGCDQTLYDNTCQLREKRLDIEEGLAEEKKTNEGLKKELESLQKKAKVIDTALKTAQNDLEAFQLEKQQKINELDVVVTLKLHQIQHVIGGILPQDLAQTLVFDASGLTRLQHRTKELEHEKHLQRRQMKESRRKHVQLIKDRKHMETKIEEIDETCNQMMISKFGCIVDLEKLETITVNRNIEELKEKLRMTEIQFSEELQDWDETISHKKHRITDLIRENTRKLDQLTLLFGEKKQLEGSLDSRQKNLGGEFTGQRKSDVHERQRLIQLVHLQAQEIDALKEEITLLSHKGGHILPPAQPPVRRSPTTSNL